MPSVVARATTRYRARVGEVVIGRTIVRPGSFGPSGFRFPPLPRPRWARRSFSGGWAGARLTWAQIRASAVRIIATYAFPIHVRGRRSCYRTRRLDGGAEAVPGIHPMARPEPGWLGVFA